MTVVTQLKKKFISFSSLKDQTPMSQVKTVSETSEREALISSNNFLNQFHWHHDFYQISSDLSNSTLLCATWRKCYLQSSIVLEHTEPEHCENVDHSASYWVKKRKSRLIGEFVRIHSTCISARSAVIWALLLVAEDLISPETQFWSWSKTELMSGKVQQHVLAVPQVRSFKIHLMKVFRCLVTFLLICKLCLFQ